MNKYHGILFIAAIAGTLVIFCLQCENPVNVTYPPTDGAKHTYVYEGKLMNDMRIAKVDAGAPISWLIPFDKAHINAAITCYTAPYETAYWNVVDIAYIDPQFTCIILEQRSGNVEGGYMYRVVVKE